MLEMAKPKSATGSPLRLGLALGFLSALGPIAIDLYLPAFPAIARELVATPGEVQRTLSAFLLALAVAQIPIGTFGDRFGRKLPLLLGLSLFAVACIACALSGAIDRLIALRFLAGLGVCAGTAVSRAMIRDLSSGHQAARLMAFSFLIIGISPILAPLVGSLLLRVLPWQGLFVVLAVLGTLAVVLVALALPETLPPEKRVPRGTPILPGYRALLRDRRYLGWALVAGLVTTIPFAYVTAAPFVFVGLFGLGGQGYSLLLALSAVCSIASTQFAPGLMRRWGARAMLVRISLAGATLAVAMGALAWTGGGSLIVFQIYSMALFALAGLMLTPAAVSALDASPPGAAGAAAGALGALQLTVTAGASWLISLFPAFSLAPLLTLTATALTLACVISMSQRD
jgi:DHA1 family bicyclomycin/chloramphenicol resistance-like MFS transporter